MLAYKLIAALFLSRVTVTLVASAPPLEELALAAEEELNADALISTELTLGSLPRQHPSRVPANDNGWLSLATLRHQPVNDASTSENQAVTGEDVVSGRQGRVGESSSDPLRGPGPLFHLPPHLRRLRIPITAGLDQHIGHAHYGSGPSEYRLVFPLNAEYVHSPWFLRFLRDATIALRPNNWYGRSLYEPLQTPLGHLGITDILFRPGKFLRVGHVYKLAVPQVFSPAVEPGEVLIKFHYMISLPDQHGMRRQISVWSTRNGGSSLAFLGLFHCPPSHFGRIVERARAQSYIYRESLDGQSFSLKPVMGQN